MSGLAPEMTPPDGEVRRGKVAFDGNTLALQKLNKAPRIGGPANALTARVMTKDPLWVRRGRPGLGGQRKSTAFGSVRAFSVLNGTGKQDSLYGKYEFYREHYFVGLATKTMEDNSIGNGSGIEVAVDKQGLTWMHNNGPGPIRSGQEVMIEIPEDTQQAEQLMASLGGGQIGVPEDRFTGHPVAWDHSQTSVIIRGDLARAFNVHAGVPGGLGGQPRPQGAAPILPSSKHVAQSLRDLLALGALLGSWNVAGGVDVARATEVAAIRSGALDGAIIQALFESFQSIQAVGGNGAADMTRFLAQMKGTGMANHLTAMGSLVEDAGRDRVIGRAINTAAPGDMLSILLYGS